MENETTLIPEQNDRRTDSLLKRRIQAATVFVIVQITLTVILKAVLCVLVRFPSEAMSILFEIAVRTVTYLVACRCYESVASETPEEEDDRSQMTMILSVITIAAMSRLGWTDRDIGLNLIATV